MENLSGIPSRDLDRVQLTPFETNDNRASILNDGAVMHSLDRSSSKAQSADPPEEHSVRFSDSCTLLPFEGKACIVPEEDNAIVPRVKSLMNFLRVVTIVKVIDCGGQK